MDRDRIDLQTPEGITLGLTLAGPGSRGLALIVDSVIQLVLFIGLALAFRLLTGYIGVVGFLVAIPAMVFVYPIFYEVRGAGQTPGKRLMKLRVVRTDGGPVKVAASSIRNLLRIVDFLPTLYIVGMLSIFLTSRNQRLGDMAAGTVVVQEKKRSRSSAESSAPLSWPPLPSFDLALDLGRLNAEDVALVRRFLVRRLELPPKARNRVADELAHRLELKLGQRSEIAPERFLEWIVATKHR